MSRTASGRPFYEKKVKQNYFYIHWSSKDYMYKLQTKKISFNQMKLFLKSTLH